MFDLEALRASLAIIRALEDLDVPYLVEIKVTPEE